VAKTVDGVTTAYVLDPAAGLTQVLQETTAGQTTSYMYGHDLLAQYDSGTWAYHVNDGLGSVRQLADPAGQVVQSHSFSPFGVPLGGSGGEPYGFTGEQWDASAGLVFLRARYYAPATGRFLSKDLWTGDQLWPQALNPYVYVVNNPINLIDPSGLQGVGEEEPEGPYWWEPQGYTFVDFLELFLQDPRYAVVYTLARQASLPDTAGVGPFRRDLSATIFQEYARGLEAYVAVVSPPVKLALENFPGGGRLYQAFQAVTGEDVFFGTEYSPRERYLIAVGALFEVPGFTDEIAQYGDDIFIRFINKSDYDILRNTGRLRLFNERDLYATTPEYLLREVGECPERGKIAEKLLMSYDNTEYFVIFRGRGPNKLARGVRDTDLPREMTWIFPVGTKTADISDAVIIGAQGATETKLTVELLLKLLALQPGPP
jgi:RHS repeat-associated protein